jgi:hypothetical protein
MTGMDIVQKDEVGAHTVALSDCLELSLLTVECRVRSKLQMGRPCVHSVTESAVVAPLDCPMLLPLVSHLDSH